MGEFSITHLLLIGGIALLFFGPSRLPGLGQSLGKAIKGFKEGLNEIDAEAKDITHQRLDQPTPTATETKTTQTETKKETNRG